MKPRAYKTLTLAIIAALLAGGSGAVGSGARRVGGHVPLRAMARANRIGRHAASARIPLAISLAPRDPAGLEELTRALYDPNDSRYHKFLTPAEYRQRFGATDEDVANVVSSLRSRGLAVTKVHQNNLLIEATAPSAVVEQAFQLELNDFQNADGTVSYAPSTEPLLQGPGADKVVAVNGLNSFVRRHTHRLQARGLAPHASISDFMTPAKIRTAYNTTAMGQSGAGESLALFELDGYAASDISTYTTQFGIAPAPTLQNVLISDGSTTATNTAGQDTGEVCLDIELAMALAPGLSKVVVYIAPNNDAGVLAAYQQIANDNSSKTVSTSWGYYEGGNLNATLTAEYNIFHQMYLQGQTIFAAAGDSGAYDEPSTVAGHATTLAVDDPASQPYVTGVGGTSLSANITTGAYSSETSWNNVDGGGGGGISSKWTQVQAPYQQGFSTVTNGLGSTTTMRMVPDVSLDADPETGYPVYYSGGWHLIGGTSAAAPLWAAYAALVNQGLIATGQSRLGFLNTKLYSLAGSGAYSTLFHDIADGSTNMHYPAVSGYDMATGLGSFNGYNLYKALVGPAAPTNVISSSSATAITITWNAVAGATSYKLYRGTAAAGPFTLLTSGITALTYADSTSVGTSYYYVSAVNAAAEGAGSSVVFGTIGVAAPSTPTGLTGVVQ